MSLEEKLKSNTKLYTSLKEIKACSENIWKNPLLPWFTNHNVSHSEEIIHLLGNILSPIEDSNHFLSDDELFILLASAYLHDIGMQNLKVGDISIDELTPENYEYIRKEHAQKSHDLILKRLIRLPERDDIHIPAIADDYLRVIAKVSKGHTTDFFDEIITDLQKNSIRPDNKKVRGDLLTALLMIADEFDMHNKRADFSETVKFNLSGYSAVHWFKHHYVDGVEIKDSTLSLTLTFHPDSEEYRELIKELIVTKLQGQIEKINPVLRESTSGALHLNENIHIEARDDETKRKMLPEALEELKKMLQKDKPLKSGISESEDVTGHSIPKVSKIFTGMEDERRRFKEVLEQACVISIEGLGGIGKTEFAAKCVEEYLDEDKVVWFDCYSDSKLDSLIENCGYIYVLKGESKTEKAKYSGFTDLIERDGRIVFLDNFQDATDESFKNFLAFSERRLSKAKIVLITREHPSLGSVRACPVELKGLKKDALEYAKKFIEAYYPKVTVGEDSLRNICDAVEGHPLAIDLAIQLLHYGEAPENITDKIIHLKGRSEELSHRLLDEIFEHPKSTNEEKELLLNFSVFRTKVEAEAFNYISDSVDRNATLHTLMDKQMIYRDGNLYGTHPLVRKFCFHRLKNKDERQINELNVKASEYFKSRRKEKLNPTLEEEIFFHLLNGEKIEELADLISDKGEEFIRLGHTNSLKEMMEKAVENGIDRAEFYLYSGDIAEIRGEWDEALKCFDRAFNFRGVSDGTSAMAYIKYGEMLFRRGKVNESLGYFEDAYDLCKKTKYKKEEARSLNNIGLVNEAFEKLELAEKQINEALKISRDIEDNSGVATYLNNSGIILASKEDLVGALEKHNESLQITEKTGDKQGIAMSLNNIGSVLCSKDDLKGALEKNEKSLLIYEEIGDKLGIAVSINNAGVILRNKGDSNGALEKFTESKLIYEEIGVKIILASCYKDIGILYLNNKKDSQTALENFFKAKSLQNQMGIKEKETLAFIFEVRKALGLRKFKELAEYVFQNLPEDFKPYIDIKDFTRDETVRIEEKVGRNDPCPCGSGKKYKKCCESKE